jgi:hypothetical protein
MRKMNSTSTVIPLSPPFLLHKAFITELVYNIHSGWECVSVAECVLSMCEAPGSMPSTGGKKERKEREKGNRGRRGRKEGKKEGRREGRKEDRKEVRQREGECVDEKKRERETDRQKTASCLTSS